MSNNQQPFSPPLTAEERALWESAYWKLIALTRCTIKRASKTCDDAIRERRRRFGVAEPSEQELFRKVFGSGPKAEGIAEIDPLRAEVKAFRDERNTLRDENGSLRAEVERLTKERDEERNNKIAPLRIEGKTVVEFIGERNHLRERTEKLDAVVAWQDNEITSLSKKADGLRSEIRRLTFERDDAKARLDLHRDNGGTYNIVDFIARAEKAEADAALLREQLTAASCEFDEAAKERDAARAELAAARPVLEAVARFHDPLVVGWQVCDGEALQALRDYADSQRAARAAKEGGAS